VDGEFVGEVADTAGARMGSTSPMRAAMVDVGRGELFEKRFCAGHPGEGGNVAVGGDFSRQARRWVPADRR